MSGPSRPDPSFQSADEESAAQSTIHAINSGAPSSPPGASSTLRIRCPHCDNLVVSQDGSLVDIICDVCGSHFSLVADRSDTRSSSVYKTLGRFDLVERLGIGAFGEVWKARDRELDRTVAIKVPRKECLSGDEAEKFLREARAAARLRHPHIVGIHEVGKQGETIYIVSDLVRGVSLADWLTAQRPHVRQAAEICRTIAGALHHAHESGVVHRDLKPANVMLDD
ncbi:MAG TPA: serine/threonine-protein kinase, partial [Pirellulales bacterium]|nr:serine/threonine-protein kinase [Pirellulales bacterium]